MILSCRLSCGPDEQKRSLSLIRGKLYTLKLKQHVKFSFCFRYHKLEQLLCWGPYQRLCMFFMEGLSGVQFKVYGDVPKTKNPVNSLLVANHQCVSDWIIIDSFAMRLGNAGWLNFEQVF